MPILGTIASQITGRLSTTAYESISTVTVGATSVATITFSSIPSTYTHLQIRGIGRVTGTGNREALLMQFNGDTASNYYWHQLIGGGAGSPAGENGGGLTGDGRVGSSVIPADDTTAGTFGAAIIDISDYKNTNKYTVSRSLSGQDQNTTTGRICFCSTLWQNTSAVTSITLYCPSVSFKQYTQFALYGIKGA